MTYNYTLNRIQRFTIRSFRFIANHPVIYLHCFLMVCHTNASDSRCQRGCAQPIRARRHIEAEMGDSVTRMRDSVTGMRDRVRRDTVVDGSMLYEITPGPMKAADEKEKKRASTKGQGGANLSPVLVGVGATFGGLFLVVCAILVFVLHRKSKPEVPVQMGHVTSYEQSGGANLSSVLVGVGATFGGLFPCGLRHLGFRPSPEEKQTGSACSDVVTSYKQSGVTND
ncbi:predicted protein [Nematostella vectensis]|uniref:ZP domain-containing protein n=1 Tax=Nematostella vectensis TaxID=45351 RepID=A7T5S3_NEMVE|nr:predicted protein [Nematostella vectensis]|eukprot:XP_001620791.1 hypothetical protein NEMVEDRAFT_v1g222703 [Nematostella vectensis]